MLKLKILIYILGTLVLASCHSSQSASPAPGRLHSVSQGSWHDVYMPVKVSVDKPINQSLTGRATMVRDSMVHISMRMLGFEVAVMHIENDTMWVIDKFHKYRFVESLDKILGKHKMSLGALQDIILGIGEGDMRQFDNPASQRTVTITYDDRAITPAGSVAANVDINAPMQRDDIEANLTWGLDDAQWEKPRDIKFSPPRGYRMVTIDDVLKALKAM